MSHTSSPLPTQPLLRILQRLRATFWRRRLLIGLVRAAWLALLVPTIVMAGYLWLGWQTPWYSWLSLSLLLAFVVLLWAIRPIRLMPMTHRLDRHLGARTQLITAYEITDSPNKTTDSPVIDQLMHNAVNVSAEARRQVRLLNRSFWLEMQALVAVAALLGALLMLDALSPNVPAAPTVGLPPQGQEPGAEQVTPPDAQLMPPPFQQPQQLTQAQVQAALEALAEALRDQAVTRGVAEAIDQGDLGGAAEALRRLADQLEGLSGEAQQELGDSLQEASEGMGGETPGFTEPLQSGSQALERGDTAQGGQALEELAETLDQLAEGQQPADSPQPGGEPGETTGEPAEPEESGEGENGGGDGDGEGETGEGEQGLGQEEGRLPLDGEPLELENEAETETEERVLQPGELDAAGEGETNDSPFARQPLNPLEENNLGADPLTYPWEKRDVVRKYFTPQ